MKSLDYGAKTNPKWTDEDKRFLVHHRMDGREALAAALGRSEKAVARMGERLGVYIPVRPEQGELCPICSRWLMTKGTRAYRAGMCQVCWDERKAWLLSQKAAEAKAKRLYESEKKRAQRA